MGKNEMRAFTGQICLTGRPVVEMVFVMTAVFLALRFVAGAESRGVHGWIMAGVSGVLAVIALHDQATGRIPDALNALLFVLGILDWAGEGMSLSGKGWGIAAGGMSLSGRGWDIAGEGMLLPGRGCDIVGEGMSLSGKGWGIAAGGMSLSGKGWDIAGKGLSLSERGWGFAAAGAVFFLISIVSRNGIGGGDIKLVAAAGFLCGLRKIAAACMIGFFFAGLYGVVMMAFRKASKEDRFPLGPFLCLGIGWVLGSPGG